MTPLERVEREVRELKATPEFVSPYGDVLGDWAALSETRKLEQLVEIDWHDTTPLERLCVIDGEVDLNRVSPGVQRVLLGELRDQVLSSRSDTPRPPSPSEVIANPAAYLPEPGNGNDGGQDRGHGR